MAELQSFADVLAWVLTRANEETDGTSDWNSEATTAVVAAHRDLVGRYPWMSLEKYPPGVVLVPAKITTLTITVTGGQTAGTFGGSGYASSLTNYKIYPDGKDYIIRITAHTAGATSFTADAVPEDLTAKACTVYQDEIALASDLQHFVNCLWADKSDPVRIITDERVRKDWPEPASAGWPPEAAVRIGKTRIRLSSYPDARKRLDYPYTYDPGDPSGSSELTIESYLRPILAQLALPTVLRLKKAEAEAKEASQEAEQMVARGIAREQQLRRSIFGQISHEQVASPWL